VLFNGLRLGCHEHSRELHRQRSLSASPPHQSLPLYLNQGIPVSSCLSLLIRGFFFGNLIVVESMIHLPEHQKYVSCSA
jgi:hypothetical protein